MQLRDLRIHSPKGRRLLSDFLQKHDLFFEDNTQELCEHAYAVALYDTSGEDEVLVATGACFGPVLKYFAMEDAYRGQNLLGTLLTACIKWQYAQGRRHFFVYTSPKNGIFFANNGFHLLAATPDVALYENILGGPESFAKACLSTQDGQILGENGAERASLVLNANPFTLGHKHLVEYAAGCCDVLHIFVLEADFSQVPFAHRLALVEQGVAQCKNMRAQIFVHAGGPYMISAASFPSYFLKESVPSFTVQHSLDAILFATQVAPHFSVTRRFVGEEPHCAVTNAYNTALAQNLPKYGVELVEIPRLHQDGEAVSASRVRALWQLYTKATGQEREVLAQRLQSLVPFTTWQYMRDAE